MESKKERLPPKGVALFTAQHVLGREVMKTKPKTTHGVSNPVFQNQVSSNSQSFDFHVITIYGLWCSG